MEIARKKSTVEKLLIHIRLVIGLSCIVEDDDMKQFFTP